VTGRFDGGRITSDGGGLLLREVDHRLVMLRRLAGKRDLTGERRDRGRDDNGRIHIVSDNEMERLGELYGQDPESEMSRLMSGALGSLFGTTGIESYELHHHQSSGRYSN
jgi:hypothetical protein